MLREEELRSSVGYDVVDRDGKAIGSVDTIFNDGETGAPEWIGVQSGVFRHHKHLVPAATAERGDGRLRLPFTKDLIRRAPTYDKGDRRGMLGLGEYRLAISKEKEREASAYYESHRR
jgi:PRC-barrel domain protein